MLRIPTGGFEGHPTADEITRILMLRAGEPDRENASEATAAYGCKNASLGLAIGILKTAGEI